MNTPKTAEELIQGIDFELLKEQKKALLEITENCDDVPKLEKIEGVIALINEIQDYAVDILGIDENIIFDLHPDEDEEPIFSEKTIKAFKNAWGQSHSELCAALGYNKRTSDDVISLDFFWIAEDKKWYNKEASGFTYMEQLIADYLRNNN